MRRYCTSCEAVTNFAPPPLPWDLMETPEPIVICDECQSEQPVDESSSKDDRST